MDTMKAFAMGEATRGQELKVFDWDKAAKLIAERRATYAEAGLARDWDYTGGAILRDGEPYSESYTYLASTWATPQLEVDDETIDCYRMASEVPGWDSDTKWPPSALAILKAQPS